MKKFLSVLLVAIITVTSLSVQAFAVNLRQYTVYDEYGNEFRAIPHKPLKNGKKNGII